MAADIRTEIGHMEMAMPGGFLCLHRVLTKEDYDELLKTIPEHEVLGSQDWATRLYHFIIFKDVRLAPLRAYILFCEILGAGPQMLFDLRSSLMVTGFDDWLYFVSTDKLEVRIRHKLASPYIAVVLVEERLIVFEDIGVSAFKLDGSELWSRGVEDRINDFQIQDRRLHIATDNDGSYTLDLDGYCV